VQFGIVLRAGRAYVLIEENKRLAYSPNAAALTSFELSEKTDFTRMGQFVTLAIPTVAKGAKEKFVNIGRYFFWLET
jgi:hypothetical protein